MTTAHMRHNQVHTRRCTALAGTGRATPTSFRICEQAFNGSSSPPVCFSLNSCEQIDSSCKHTHTHTHTNTRVRHTKQLANGHSFYRQLDTHTHTDTQTQTRAPSLAFFILVANHCEVVARAPVLLCSLHQRLHLGLQLGGVVLTLVCCMERDGNASPHRHMVVFSFVLAKMGWERERHTHSHRHTGTCSLPLSLTVSPSSLHLLRRLCQALCRTRDRHVPLLLGLA